MRGCLRALLTNEAAVKFTWYGRHGNVGIQSYESMNIIKGKRKKSKKSKSYTKNLSYIKNLVLECAIKKYPDARPNEITAAMKKWFHYAKDRLKKLQSN